MKEKLEIKKLTPRHHIRDIIVLAEAHLDNSSDRVSDRDEALNVRHVLMQRHLISHEFYLHRELHKYATMLLVPRHVREHDDASEYHSLLRL